MRNAKALLAVGIIVVLAGFLFVSVTGNDPPAPSPTQTISTTAVLVDETPAQAEGQQGTPNERSGTSGLPTVALVALPAEAQRTYELVLAGGPYPYPQDDGVFGNREGNLPAQEYGWYREYTVETPGAEDRGARRLVVGEDGLFFYTDDHYQSFREVLE